MTTDLLDPTTRFDAGQVQRWLVTRGYLISDINAFVDELARTVVEAGLPVERFTIGMPVLHPQIAGFQFRWYAGKPVERRQFAASAETLRMLNDSPIKANYEGRRNRCRIGPDPVDGEYPIVTDLREEGFTDYITYPVPFLDGTFKSLSIATRQASGFDDRDVDVFGDLMASLAPALEVRSLNHLARSLLDVYIGPSAGGRVLNGDIKRGDGETIQSVVWFSDLRGSTDLSMSLDGPSFIRLLNDFFGAVSGAVTENGGEVLKFIGDAVLAIFPCHDMETMACGASAHAEKAAREAIDRIAAINREASEEGRPEISFGIALHIGDVFYGNVGGENRLDFTVIGPAVNVASRIESLCRDAGLQLLVSEEFAGVTSSDFAPLGSFQFKGVDGWRTVYAPHDEVATGA